MTSFMVKILTLIVVVVVATGAVLYDVMQTPSIVEPVVKPAAVDSTQKAPDFTFKTLSGKEERLSFLPEKGVLLHFWASWCAVCMAEFPSLLETVGAQKGQVALIAVSTDDSFEKMQRALAGLREKYPTVVDYPHVYWVHDADKALSLQMFSVARVPETFFIHVPDLGIRYKAVGETDWTGEPVKGEMTALVRPR